MAEPSKQPAGLQKIIGYCPVLRLAQFEYDGDIKIGALTEKDGDVVDVCAVDPSIPSNMKEFLEAGPSAMVSAERLVCVQVHSLPLVCTYITFLCSTVTLSRAVESALKSQTNIIKKGDCTLKAPISNPPKIVCIGMNYVDHCTELNMPVPIEPVVFSKFSSAINDPYGVVVLDEETQVRL